jgi:hypothetical protein
MQTLLPSGNEQGVEVTNAWIEQLPSAQLFLKRYFMAKKQDKKNARSSGVNPSGAALLPEEVERVRLLIVERHSKAALQLAKDLFKRSSAAEDLLVDAYRARMEDLLSLGMAVEAKTVLGIVRERFPAALPRMVKVEQEICARDGRLDQVVAPLADASLAVEERERIEIFIRQRVHDLSALAAVTSLPQEHPLRVAAGALAAAFQAVTEGPVDQAALALQEVSRRSPLASWKALIRAIASYHRREDEACSQWLRTIAEDSVPARLLPAFVVMRGKKLEAKLSPAEHKLIAIAGDHAATLRPALAAMEKALHSKKQKPILDAARGVNAASESCDARLRERLRRHIAVRSGMLRIPPPSINAALGGAPRWDASYFRLLARTLEEQQFVEGRAEAAIVWEDFRREALKENWFAAGGLVDGILSLHMAQLVANLPDELVEEMREREVSYRKQGLGSGPCLPSPAVHFERACTADPHSESFQSWLNWAVKRGSWQVVDQVAEKWRHALPGDIQPLLHLVESAEKRNAFKKSLSYLEQAEKLDRLNPAVRRAKLRLLLATVLRHLSQRKSHLAQGGIAELASLPEVRSGEIAALAAALSWCVAVVDGDKAACAAELNNLEQGVGKVAAHLLLITLLRESTLSALKDLPQVKISRAAALDLLTGTVRACLLGESAGLVLMLPSEWDKTLIAALYLPNCPVDAAQMLVLGEAALLNNSPELAYAVSSVGLLQGKVNARFLFLRARVLPGWARLRLVGCMSAALELARRERNTVLIGKILDCLNETGKRGRLAYRYDPRIASKPISSEQLDRILEEERKLEQFPIYEASQIPKFALEDDPDFCDCPECRAQRGEWVDPDELDDFDEDEDFDEDDDLGDEDFDGPMPPPEMMRGMLEQVLKMLSAKQKRQIQRLVDAGDDPLTAMDKVINGGLSMPDAAAKKAKAAKPTPPQQGSLFEGIR